MALGQTKCEENKEQRLRAFKLKTECLRLTLKNLQDMLNAEKIKLNQEKGEVEGLAREKGLVLLEPDLLKMENLIEKPLRKIEVNTCVPQQSKPIQTQSTEVKKGQTERGQGDIKTTVQSDSRITTQNDIKTAPITTSEVCVLSNGIKWDPQYYEDFNNYMWEGFSHTDSRNKEPTSSDSGSTLTDTLDWTYMGDKPLYYYNLPDRQTDWDGEDQNFTLFNNEYVAQFTTDAIKSKLLDYTPDIRPAGSNFATADDAISLNSEHLTTLMNQVDNITNAIEELRKH